MNTVKIEPISRAEALRYLAAGGSTPDENLSALMDSCEKKLLAAAHGKFTFRVFDIENMTEDEVALADSELVLSGRHKPSPCVLRKSRAARGNYWRRCR